MSHAPGGGLPLIEHIGFEGERLIGGYYVARLSQRIAVLAYPLPGGYCAAFFPIPDDPPDDLYTIYVGHVMNIVKSESTFRTFMRISRIPDQLTLKCLILEALPAVEKHYADCYFNLDTAAGTPVE